MHESITAAIAAALSVPGWILVHRSQKRPELQRAAKLYVYSYCITALIAGMLMMTIFNQRGSALIGLAFGCAGLVDNTRRKQQSPA